MRIIGVERDSNPPEVVAAAEHELTRRLGGTRKQAGRGITYGGLINAAFGVIVFGCAVSILFSRGVSFLREESAISGFAGEATFCIAMAALAFVGLAFTAVGLGVLMRINWVLRRARSIPFVRTWHVAALAAEPALEDLLDTIGRDRRARAPEEVEAAERGLTDRLKRAQEDREKPIRKWGTTACVIGGLLALHAFYFMIAMTARGPTGPEADAFGTSALHLIHLRMWCMSAVNACVGGALLAGGLGLRKRKEWGRKLIVATIWTFLACMLAFDFLALGWQILVAGLKLLVIVTLVWFLVRVGILVWIFWSIARLLSRPEIKEACGAGAGSVEELLRPFSREARRKRARRIWRWVILGVMLVGALDLGAAAWLMQRVGRAKFAEAVYEATWQNQPVLLDRLLKDHPGLANARVEGTPVLHTAVALGRKEAVQMLLSFHADVNALDERQRTPLHRAAYQGRAPIAELLLANGAEVNARDNEGLTPLHEAGNRNVAELLLEHGADPDARSNGGDTPLHTAAWEGHLEVGRLLVERGADVNGADAYGQTPLHEAVQRHSYEYGPTGDLIAETRGLREMAEFLLANGADINAQDQDGETVLHGVAESGWADWVELVLARGADPEPRDAEGQTPLDLALRKGHNDVVELLKKHRVRDD